jgi:hypothetical protein
MLYVFYHMVITSCVNVAMNLSKVVLLLVLSLYNTLLVAYVTTGMGLVCLHVILHTMQIRKAFREHIYRRNSVSLMRFRGSFVSHGGTICKFILCAESLLSSVGMTIWSSIMLKWAVLPPLMYWNIASHLGCMFLQLCTMFVTKFIQVQSSADTW